MSWLLKDTKGKSSWTLTMIVPGFSALTMKFLAASLSLPIVGAVPPMGGGEYAAAAMVLLGAWITREATEKADPPGRV